MQPPIYLDSSIFLEMGSKKSKHRKQIRKLLEDCQEDKTKVYTSIITVQEISVAVYLRGALAKDTYGDISAIARVYEITKEIALTAAKNEAALKDIALQEAAKRDPKKPETEDEKLERICENRRRKWDCFHLATAQFLGCPYLYSTDEKLQKRPAQLGLKNMQVVPPGAAIARITGPLVNDVGTEKI